MADFKELEYRTKYIFSLLPKYKQQEIEDKENGIYYDDNNEELNGENDD